MNARRRDPAANVILVIGPESACTHATAARVRDLVPDAIGIAVIHRSMPHAGHWHLDRMIALDNLDMARFRAVVVVHRNPWANAMSQTERGQARDLGHALRRIALAYERIYVELAVHLPDQPVIPVAVGDLQTEDGITGLGLALAASRVRVAGTAEPLRNADAKYFGKPGYPRKLIECSLDEVE